MLLIITLIPMNISASASGVSYVLSDGVLTVSGSGECTDVWKKNYHVNSVNKIVIESGITSTGQYSFCGCAYAKSIEIADGVTRIGRGSFTQCYALDYIIIPRSVTTIEQTAFGGGDPIQDVYYCGNSAQWGKIDIGTYNNNLLTAKFHYNYDPYAINFSDVYSDAYYYDAVQWAVKNEVTAGVGGNRFDPDRQCTRGQVVTFLWRAAGKPIVSTNVSFTDVQSGAFYYEAVKWAVTNGITQGVGGNRFAPNDTCTRGQVVTFLHRAENLPSASPVSSFSDVPATAFYYDAVNWAVSNDITKGVGNNRFAPNNTCTRGQVVTFLYRAQ